ncbi:MAG: hypothetical protein HUJ83_09765 [Veillonella sp.]|nr:hypothetical protein [Veillonella sp.]
MRRSDFNEDIDANSNNLPVNSESYDLIETCRAYENKMERVAAVCGTLRAASYDFKEMMSNYNETRLMISQIDAKLDAFLYKLDTDLKKFKAQLPMVERQLDRIADRLDGIVMEIIRRNRGQLSREELEQQSQLIDIFKADSDSFNNLIMKIMLR